MKNVAVGEEVIVQKVKDGLIQITTTRAMAHNIAMQLDNNTPTVAAIIYSVTGIDSTKVFSKTTERADQKKKLKQWLKVAAQKG